MKLFGCLVLIILVSNAGAMLGTGNDDAEDELDAVLRNLNNRRNFNNRRQWKERNLNKDSLIYAAKKGTSSTSSDTSDTSTVDNPIRIAIFNAGEYDAHLKVNYILNDKQQEQELLSDIKEGEHRSVFMPVTAIYVRIRIQEMGVDDEFITDAQIYDLTGVTTFCYLLAHTKSHPVYGICPHSYEAMLADWGV